MYRGNCSELPKFRYQGIVGYFQTFWRICFFIQFPTFNFYILYVRHFQMNYLMYIYQEFSEISCFVIKIDLSTKTVSKNNLYPRNFQTVLNIFRKISLKFSRLCIYCSFPAVLLLILKNRKWCIQYWRDDKYI